MQRTSLALPISVIIAGVIIAGAVYLTRTSGPPNPAVNTPPASTNITVRPVDATDHILGNPNAEIVIIEYSDTECPFCKNFHETMHQVMDTYGKDGKVAWVYRHFPIYKGERALHPKAGKQAEATECAAELAGADGFWKYIDRLYKITPSNNQLSESELPEIAVYVGIDRAAFTACLSSGKYADAISKAYDEAVLAGANGTPYSVIITKDNPPLPITGGALPYTAMKTIIDSILSGAR